MKEEDRVIRPPTKPAVRTKAPASSKSTTTAVAGKPKAASASASTKTPSKPTYRDIAKEGDENSKPFQRLEQRLLLREGQMKGD